MFFHSSIVIIFVAVCHDFEKFDADLDFSVAAQRISNKGGSDFQVDHFEGAADNPCQNIGVPEFISELRWQDNEVIEGVILENQRALLPLRVPVLDVRVDAQKHLECLLCKHIHRLSEVSARHLVRSLLSSEKIVNHSTAHVIADLFKLLVDLLGAVVIGLSDQLADEDTVCEGEELAIYLGLLVEHLFADFRVLGVLFLL